MFKISSIWSALAAMLTLVALYLFLTRSSDAATLFRGGANSLGSVFAVLQGREARVGAR